MEISTVDSGDADCENELCGAESGSNNEARIACVFVGQQWLFDGAVGEIRWLRGEWCRHGVAVRLLERI